MSLLFEWDNKKAEENRKKHGVSFDEATSVLDDPLSVTIPDPDHSADESRFVTMGMSQRNRILVIVHTDRGSRLRMISARQAESLEVRKYEQGKQE
ncbi:MAG: BrnT family toxin [Bryobacterales bacterium]